MILPTKPAMPRHKGKIEAGVKYAQDNGSAGKRSRVWAPRTCFWLTGKRTVADTRIHGTTRQQVRAHFLTVEKPKLLPLPASLFPGLQEAPRTVHRDGYVELDKAYYSAPPGYVRPPGLGALGRQNGCGCSMTRMEQIALHVRRRTRKVHHRSRPTPRPQTHPHRTGRR